MRRCLGFFRSFSAFLLVLGSVGCAKSYDVHMDTYADLARIPRGFPEGSSFAVCCEDGSLFHKEVAHKISVLLKDEGFVLVDSERADYRLTFGTDMESYWKTEYVLRYIPGDEEVKKGSIKDSEGNKVKYKEETSTKGELVYEPVEKQYFNKSLFIAVLSEETPVWEGSAYCKGKTDDLRHVIDYLLVSIFDYFGENTKRSIVVTLYENDEEMQYFREMI